MDEIDASFVQDAQAVFYNPTHGTPSTGTRRSFLDLARTAAAAGIAVGVMVVAMNPASASERRNGLDGTSGVLDIVMVGVADVLMPMLPISLTHHDDADETPTEPLDPGTITHEDGTTGLSVSGSGSAATAIRAGHPDVSEPAEHAGATAPRM